MLTFLQFINQHPKYQGENIVEKIMRDFRETKRIKTNKNKSVPNGSMAVNPETLNEPEANPNRFIEFS